MLNIDARILKLLEEQKALLDRFDRDIAVTKTFLGKTNSGDQPREETIAPIPGRKSSHLEASTHNLSTL